MTKTAMNVAIATALGWKNFFYDEVLKVQFGLGPENITLTNIPNYTEDLNACAEMEKVLTESQKTSYTQLMVGSFGRAWDATSAQRCEAFLRCLSLWIEDEAKDDKVAN